MGRRLLPASRYMIIVAVVALFLLATTLIIYAGVEAFQLVWKAFTAGRVSTAGAKALVLASIERSSCSCSAPSCTSSRSAFMPCSSMTRCRCHPGWEIHFGAGIALVIGALTYFLGQKPKRDRGDG